MREKKKVDQRPQKQIDKFQEAIESCWLSKIPTFELKFTWSNKRRGVGFTKEKLDRVLANHNGMSLLPDSACEVLPTL